MGSRLEAWVLVTGRATGPLEMKLTLVTVVTVLTLVICHLGTVQGDTEDVLVREVRKPGQLNGVKKASIAKKKLKNKTRKQKKKKRKTKKAKRNRKNKSRNKKKGGLRQQCDSKSVTTDCMESVVTTMNFLQNQMTNFINQYKRIQSFNKTVNNKLGKSTVFSSASSYLLSALGGDISSVSCGDSGTNDTANATLAVATYNILNSCNASVTSNCTMPDDLVPDAVISNFETYCLKQFYEAKEKSDECRTGSQYSSNGTAACLCWNNVASIISSVKNSGECVASSYSKKVKKFKEKCINTFSECRKQEDNSVQLVYACGSGSVTSTAI